MNKFELPYQPFFCEENIWSLIRMPRFAQVPCGALFISNKEHTVAMAGQRGADDGWIVWDYHVVLLEGGSKCRIWDPNSQRRAPEAAHQYLNSSFPSHVKLPLAFQPCFRLVSRTIFLETFRSDRRHMKDENGAWRAPPPSWPSPSPGHTLPQFVAMSEKDPGELLNLRSLKAHPWCARN